MFGISSHHALLFGGQPEKALTVCEEALLAFPGDGLLHVYAGDACRELKRYEEAFMWQVGSMRDANISVPFEFYLDVYFPSKRSDLDGCLKGILDCLQHAKVIKNDNNCCLIHARKFIDKTNPRIEFKIITD